MLKVKQGMCMQRQVRNAQESEMQKLAYGPQRSSNAIGVQCYVVKCRVYGGTPGTQNRENDPGQRTTTSIIPKPKML